jgi:hypothetical protein
MEVGTLIIGILIGIGIGILIMIAIQKLSGKNSQGSSTTLLSIVGKWKMPDDIASIEPLKPPFIEITNNSGGYQIIQAENRTKLEVDGSYYIPASSGAPLVGITFHYDSPTDTLIQEIGGHPFTYTRIKQ